jgi:hypothetical protein
MVMPLSASFDYLVTVRRGSAPWRAELHPDDAAARDRGRRMYPNVEPELVDPFLGPTPSVAVAGGTVTIGGSFSFELDPGMLACLRPGDVLRIARTGCDGMGVAILRRAGIFRPLRLFAAAGAVSPVATRPLTIRHVWATAHGGPPPGSASLFGPEEAQIEIDIDGDKRLLGHAEEATLGDFGVVLVQGYKKGIPGTDECVAVFPRREPLRDVVMASARLLAMRTWHRHAPTA